MILGFLGMNEPDIIQKDPYPQFRNMSTEVDPYPSAANEMEDYFDEIHQEIQKMTETDKKFNDFSTYGKWNYYKR